MRYLAMAMMVLALAACDPAQKSSNEAAKVSKDFVDDTRNAWRDLFTYHRPPKPGDPQTRFCYQMQSDIVCYDTPQTHLTSKLVGYQEGEHISYIQKGGGSMGVSTVQSQVFSGSSPYDDGYAPIATEDMGPVQTGQDISIQQQNLPAPPNAGGESPFSQKESSYVKGADTGR